MYELFQVAGLLTCCYGSHTTPELHQQQGLETRLVPPGVQFSGEHRQGIQTPDFPRFTPNTRSKTQGPRFPQGHPLPMAFPLALRCTPTSASDLDSQFEPILPRLIPSGLLCAPDEREGIQTPELHRGIATSSGSPLWASNFVFSPFSGEQQVPTAQPVPTSARPLTTSSPIPSRITTGSMPSLSTEDSCPLISSSPFPMRTTPASIPRSESHPSHPSGSTERTGLRSRGSRGCRNSRARGEDWILLLPLSGTGEIKITSRPMCSERDIYRDKQCDLLIIRNEIDQLFQICLEMAAELANNGDIAKWIGHFILSFEDLTKRLPQNVLDQINSMLGKLNPEALAFLGSLPRESPRSGKKLETPDHLIERVGDTALDLWYHTFDILFDEQLRILMERVKDETFVEIMQEIKNYLAPLVGHGAPLKALYEAIRHRCKPPIASATDIIQKSIDLSQLRAKIEIMHIVSEWKSKNPHERYIRVNILKMGEQGTDLYLFRPWLKSVGYHQWSSVRRQQQVSMPEPNTHLRFQASVTIVNVPAHLERQLTRSVQPSDLVILPDTNHVESSQQIRTFFSKADEIMDGWSNLAEQLIGGQENGGADHFMRPFLQQTTGNAVSDVQFANIMATLQDTRPDLYDTLHTEFIPTMRTTPRGIVMQNYQQFIEELGQWILGPVFGFQMDELQDLLHDDMFQSVADEIRSAVNEEIKYFKGQLEEFAEHVNAASSIKYDLEIARIVRDWMKTRDRGGITINQRFCHKLKKGQGHARSRDFLLKLLNDLEISHIEII